MSNATLGYDFCVSKFDDGVQTFKVKHPLTLQLQVSCQLTYQISTDASTHTLASIHTSMANGAVIEWIS